MISEQNSIKERIYTFIQRVGAGVSFVELEQIDGVKGDFEFALNENTLMWSGFSEEAIKAIDELIREKKVIPFPSSLIVYLMDGKALNLPIAKSLTRTYKTPRWFPVTLSTADFCRKNGIKVEGLK